MATGTPESSEALNLLRSKSMLLLRREKELLEFRQDRDRVATWFKVFHALSGMLVKNDQSSIVAESVLMLIDHLGFEVVSIYRYETGESSLVPVCTHPSGRDMGPIPVGGRDGDALLERGGGTHEAADGEARSRIATATGLQKYFWLSFPVGEANYLLLAGYGANSAAFYSLSPNDEGYFAMFGNHIAALLRNTELLEQLHREREELQAAHELLKTEVEARHQVESELRMAQKLEAVGQLAAGIAHEINTPIQYIADNIHFVSDAFDTYGTLVEQLNSLVATVEPGVSPEKLGEAFVLATKEADVEFLSAEVPEALAQTREGVEKVAEIVSAMREFARPGSQEKVPLDVNKAIRVCLTVSRNEWKYVAEAETELQNDLPDVPGFIGEINQVLLNLVVNAAHAIAAAGGGDGDKGTIRITTKRVDDAVEIRVSDTGTGIPEEIREHIFTPFFTTREVGKGTGQGLALARASIVDKHHGALEYETVVGEGTTFIVRLPLPGNPSGEVAALIS